VNQTKEAAMLVRLLEDSNQSVSKEIERLAQQERTFASKRTTIIGLGKYKMEIDIKAETEKMRS
jgi:hypothetical protein